MTDPELEAIVGGLTAAVRDLVAADLVALDTKIATLAARPAAPTLADLRQAIEGETARAVELLAARLEARPAPATLEDLRAVIEAETLKAAIAARPPAATPGKDGVSLTGAVVDRAGHLILTVSDGRALDVGPVIGGPGPAGQDGRPGRDGVIKGGLALKRIDARRYAPIWTEDGSPVPIVDGDGAPLEGPIVFPVPVYKAVWTDAAPYEEADLVTHDGSVWIAKRATRARPGEGSPDWQLAVKRGAQGERGKRGEVGPAGRDLTAITLDGTKYR